MSSPERNKLGIEEVMVAGNRGACGGVNMAVKAVSEVLDLVAGRENVYANWAIVHNNETMKKLEARGLVNVQNDWSLAPEGSIVFFSAHGVPPQYHDIAKKRNYAVVDATCPLVKVVHESAKRAQEEGQHVVYIGSEGHPEALGVLGELEPDNRTFIDISSVGIRRELPDNSKVISQTTIASSGLKDAKDELRRKFPNIIIPAKSDVCYAADNRQQAVEDLLARGADLLIIVGSPDRPNSRGSHNSRELQRKGEEAGKPSFLIDRPDEIDRSWFTDEITIVGLSSGASAGKEAIDAMINYFRDERVPISYLEQVVPERELTFKGSETEKGIDAIRRRYQE